MNLNVMDGRPENGKAPHGGEGLGMDGLGEENYGGSDRSWSSGLSSFLSASLVKSQAPTAATKPTAETTRGTNIPR